MKRLFQPVNLLLYVLVIPVFLIFGMFIAKWTGAAEGQGLAGGAIVLGYGIVSAFIALVVSLVLGYFAGHKVRVLMNIALAIALVAGFIALRAQYKNRQKANPETGIAKPNPIPKKAAVSDPSATYSDPANERLTGMGFFKPDFYDRKVLYFFGNPNLEKSVNEHWPTDSMTFKPLENGGFDIGYAPPWLQPDHLKLDYDMLYFRIISVGHEFIEVLVNTSNNQTTYVSKFAGKIAYWPEFLLSVHAVEPLRPQDNLVRIKPLNHSSPVTTAYQILAPQVVQGDWLKVSLHNDSYVKVGEGWIRWRKDGLLLVSYSLLS